MVQKKLLDYARTNEIQSVLLASSLEVYGTITNDSKPLTEEAQGFLNPMDVRSSYPMAKELQKRSATIMLKNMEHIQKLHV